LFTFSEQTYNKLKSYQNLITSVSLIKDTLFALKVNKVNPLSTVTKNKNLFKIVHRILQKGSVQFM